MTRIENTNQPKAEDPKLREAIKRMDAMRAVHTGPFIPHYAVMGVYVTDYDTIRAALTAKVEGDGPVAWLASPLVWEGHASETVRKMTRRPQPEHGFTFPLFAHPAPISSPTESEATPPASEPECDCIARRRYAWIDPGNREAGVVCAHRVHPASATEPSPAPASEGVEARRLLTHDEMARLLGDDTAHVVSALRSLGDTSAPAHELALYAAADLIERLAAELGRLREERDTLLAALRGFTVAGITYDDFWRAQDYARSVVARTSQVPHD
jgi:hypothetical protein